MWAYRLVAPYTFERLDVPDKTADDLEDSHVLLRFMERTRAESVTIKKGEREITIVRPDLSQVDAIVEQVDALLRDD